MPGGIERGRVRECSGVIRPCIRALSLARAERGVGMLEFLLALLIFSVGMLGLMSAQLAGKRAGFEASQRSNATALARDILERMRANPTQIAAYEVTGAGNRSERVPLPGADCHAALCTVELLAAFDMWQWESHLLGESERIGADAAGGLAAPRGCIRQHEGVVTVTISWLAFVPHGTAAAHDCDESPGPGEPDDAGVEATRRHHLAIATYIAGRG